VGIDFFQPVAPAAFENRRRSTRLTFLDGADSRPARVRIVLRAEEMWAARVPLKADPGGADEYAGAYYSREWGTVYEIVPTGGEFLVWCQ